MRNSSIRGSRRDRFFPAVLLAFGLAGTAPAILAQNCQVPAGPMLRVSVGGFGYVTSSDATATGISCGSVPAGGPTSTRCFTRTAGGFVTLTAIPYNSNFQFSGWAGDTSCTSNPCVVDASTSRWVRAKFTPVNAGTNVCTSVGLLGDKVNHPLNGNFPAVTVGNAFTDPNFGTTIRRITNVASDGRGANRILKSAYSTISAWNADESYLILYRTDGTGGASHELFNGKTYAFIRKLTDLPYADLEQFYWDTTRPNIVYGVGGRILYQYDVDAPSGQRLTALRDFTPQCTTGKQLVGGDDPFYNAWNSKIFGLACVSSGLVFSYNRETNTLGTTSSAARAGSGTSPQAAPSGTKLFMNSPQPGPIRIYDLNMVAGPVLDQNTGDEHASANMNFNGDDTYYALQFDPGPSGTDVGSVIQWNFNGTPNAQGRIPGRVIVGPQKGYPYPPGGAHVGGTSFHHTGLITSSAKGSMTGATLLDGELLYIDGDLATNPNGFVCRIGHHRTTSDYYFAEPHPSISPSGTRVVFSSSWGNTSNTAPVVDSYVVELPGYRP